MPLRCFLDALDGEKTSGEAAGKIRFFTNLAFLIELP